MQSLSAPAHKSKSLSKSLSKTTLENSLFLIPEQAIGSCSEGVKTPLGNITELRPEISLKNELCSEAEKALNLAMARVVAQRVLGPKHRISVCQKMQSKAVLDGLKKTSIKRNTKGAPYLSGTVACGDRNCPTCSVKKANADRVIIDYLITEHEKIGGFVIPMALTGSHQSSDDPKIFRQKMGKALRALKKDRLYTALMADLGLIGDIRVLETTYGDNNGWHTHFHILLFVSSVISANQQKKIESLLYKLWAKTSLAAGLPKPSRKHGVVFEGYTTKQNGLGKYLTKLGLELTQSHLKEGKNGSITHWGMLRYLTETPDGPKAKQYEFLFRQHALFMKGAHGIQISRGLKELYGVDEAMEQQAEEFAQLEASDPILFEFTRRQFQFGKSMMVTLMRAAIIGGKQAVLQALREAGCPELEELADPSYVDFALEVHKRQKIFKTKRREQREREFHPWLNEPINYDD